MKKIQFHSRKFSLLAGVFLLAVAQSGCDGNLSINSTPSDAVVALQKVNGDLEPIGQTPFKSTASELISKANDTPVVLVVQKEGFLSDRMLIPSFSMSDLTITVQLKTDQTGQGGAGAAGADANKPYRLILQAHRALVEGEYETAISTATEVEKINPDLAAPYLIQGIAAIRQSENPKARALFEKAKRLDPNDPAIDALIALASP